MTALPPELGELAERVVATSGLEGAEAERARRDLRAHLLDGLDAGRTPEELARRFGDPEEVAPLLRRAPPPVGRRPVPTAPEGFLASGARDLRHVLRSLRRSPTFTLTAVGVLALGIAATVVVLTVVNEVVLRPLPIRDQASVVDVWAEVPGGNSFAGFAWQDWADLRERGDVLADLAAFTGFRLRVGDRDGTGEEVVGQLVSANFFDLLGVRPSLGSLQLPEAPAFGTGGVVVLSHDFWRTSFGADPDIVGRTVRLDGHPVTVVGVGPPGFGGTFIGFPVDLWLPLAAADPFLPGFDPADRGGKPFELIGRLRPGGTPAEADRSLDAVAAELEAENPVANDGLRVGVATTTGVDHGLRRAVAAFVAVLVALAGAVLLIACLNVGGLLLVRTMARERELAVRMALGAGRGRLTRQILAESAVLVAAASGLGVLAARELNAVLRDFARSISGGVGFDLAVDGRVLALTVGAAAVAALVAGLAPAAHLLRRDPAGALRARDLDDRSSGRLRAALVAGQVAASVVLVIVTGLFARSVVEGTSTDPGFPASRVASFTLSLESETRGEPEIDALRRAVLEALRDVPGVESVTTADARPLGVARTPTRIDVPGVDPPAGRDSLVVDSRTVGTGYLGTVGIPLLRGSDIAEADAGGGAPAVVVSRAFRDRFWPGEDPVGRTIGVRGRTVRVVGMAEDARYLVQDRSPDPLLYLSRAGGVPSRSQVILRARDPGAVAGAVDEVVRRQVPGHPPVSLRTARSVLRQALFPQRVGVVLVGSMGGLALLLAALGLYGTVQFSVSRDRRQIGVRLALGGGPAAIVGTVLRRGFLLAAVGIAIGVGVTLALGPLLQGVLVAVSPSDPLTYAVVIASFATVALLASALPARRAMRIDPGEVLRGE